MKHSPHACSRFFFVGAVIALLGCGGTTEPPPAPSSMSPRTSTVTTGVAGEALSVKPSVKVVDVNNTALPGVVVNFAVTSGGGSLSATSGTTDAEGIATSGTWTLGGVAGSNTVTASIPGLTQTIIFTSTGNPGVPTSITINGGNNQNAVAGTPVAVQPSVRVADAHGNLVSGHSVTFVITAGGGSLTQGTVTTNTEGIATIGSWTLGATPGTNTLSAAATLTAVTTFTATGIDGPTVVEALTGDRQAVLPGAAAIAPTVRVKNALGVGVPGVNVTFAVGVGGGSITGTTATTNANGDATLGSWTLGAGGGLNTVVATAAVITGTGRTATLSASGCVGGGAGYKLTLCILTDMTAPQRDAFTLGAARWSEVITTDLPDVTFSGGIAAGPSGCSTNTFSLPAGSVVDDLLIFAQVRPIDGPGAVLGSAGFCRIRSAGLGGLSVMGSMQFDVADVDNLIDQGRYNSVILHEMGHVIGIGTLWTNFLVNPSSTGNVLDTHFTGANAIAGFDLVGGATYTGGQKVPVENTGGPGTANGHWRESVLANELMTGFISGTSQPLSILTVKSLIDLGYVVDETKADPLSLTLSLSSPSRSLRPPLHLINDIETGPAYAVDALGRVVRRIR